MCVNSPLNESDSEGGVSSQKTAYFKSLDVMTTSQLEHLFKTCDKTGTGKIGLDDFRELCTEFDIMEADCVAIFNDLDHDGDGQVSSRWSRNQ